MLLISYNNYTYMYVRHQFSFDTQYLCEGIELYQRKEYNGLVVWVSGELIFRILLDLFKSLSVKQFKIEKPKYIFTTLKTIRIFRRNLAKIFENINKYRFLGGSDAYIFYSKLAKVKDLTIVFPNFLIPSSFPFLR